MIGCLGLVTPSGVFPPLAWLVWCLDLKKCVCTLIYTGKLVSSEVFKRSPQPLKTGIVATAVFRRFLEFSMYRQRYIKSWLRGGPLCLRFVPSCCFPLLVPLYAC